MRVCRECRKRLYDYWFPPARRGKPASLCCNLCRSDAALRRARLRHEKLKRSYDGDLRLIAAADAALDSTEQRRRRGVAEWAMARMVASGESPDDAHAAIEDWRTSFPAFSEGNG